MKTSNKIFLTTIISIFSITVILIVSAWFFISDHNSRITGISTNASKIINKSFKIKDFDLIKISGFYNVEIIQDNSYKISLSAPDYLIDHISVVKSGKKLNIKQLQYADILPVTIKIKITIPDLKGLNSSGNSKIFFSGFKTNNLTLELFGSNKIKGNNSNINNINIFGSGLIRTNLDSCSIVNANLKLSGTGVTDLNMAGGILTGNITGNHKINYRGKVSKENITTSGNVKVNNNR